MRTMEKCIQDGKETYGDKFIDPEIGVYKIDSIEMLGRRPRIPLIIGTTENSAISFNYVKPFKDCLRHKEYKN